ncbi:protein NOI4-like [Pistacia vera]|uniref:protein NOI4-like n=1 Tax=Pistacia vera TaxID=55513 RepID=UPI0012638B61|nr:protein NOI4-like [Pistacia vera]XP_031283555.1 protein NOI4-like [Pistacia vera]
MASQDRGRALPKFGEWDVNNPATAEGFSVIFNRARDEKKASSDGGKTSTPPRNDSVYKTSDYSQYSPKRKWLCCG